MTKWLSCQDQIAIVVCPLKWLDYFIHYLSIISELWYFTGEALINIINVKKEKPRPSTDLCGTPLKTSRQFEGLTFKTSRCFLSEGQSSSYLRRFPSVPCDFHLSSSGPTENLLKAFWKSTGFVSQYTVKTSLKKSSRLVKQEHVSKTVLRVID